MGKTTVGLKIGSTSIKFVELIHEKGAYRLKNIGLEEFPFSENQEGYVNRPTFIAQKIREIIRNCRLNPRRIVTGVEGESIAVRVIKVPWMKKRELREAIRWEAEEHLPYSVEEIALGYQVLEGGTFNSGKRELSVLLVGVKKEDINEHLSLFTQVGIYPAIIDVNSLALYNLAESINLIDKAEGRAILNIGHHTTNLLVLSRGFSFLIRDIKFGGQSVTLSLIKELGVSYAEAEKIKKEFSITGKGLDKQIKEKVDGVIQEALGDLIKEMIHSFEYFSSTRGGTSVQKVFLSGGGCLIKNIDNFFSQQLGIPVERMNPFTGIIYQKEKLRFSPLVAPVFSVPLGLAMREISWYD